MLVEYFLDSDMEIYINNLQQNLKEEKLTLLHFLKMRPKHWFQSEYINLEEHWLVSKVFILCQSFLIWIQCKFLL